MLHDLLDLYRAVRAIEGIWHRVSISSQQWDILLQAQTSVAGGEVGGEEEVVITLDAGLEASAASPFPS